MNTSANECNEIYIAEIEELEAEKSEAGQDLETKLKKAKDELEDTQQQLKGFLWGVQRMVLSNNEKKLKIGP